MSSFYSMEYCQSCGKYKQKKDGQYVEVDRFICNHCIQTEVNEVNVNRVVHSVINLLNSVGFEDIIYDNFKYVLVSKTEMQRILSGKDALGVHQINNYSITERGISDLQETIYVLRHLAEIKFRAVLAHEILHSWQTRNYLHERFADDEESNKRVEGFAQMGSFLVYDDVLHHIQSQYAKEQISQMLSWDDPYYGIAFKRIYEQFHAYPGSERHKWLYIIKCARQGKLNVD